MYYYYSACMCGAQSLEMRHQRHLPRCYFGRDGAGYSRLPGLGGGGGGGTLRRQRRQRGPCILDEADAHCIEAEGGK